jgi:hypothetical protein
MPAHAGIQQADGDSERTNQPWRGVAAGVSLENAPG